ncbi:hypothetical protein V9L13_06625 [Pseudomonas sp. RSB 5.4]
MYDDEFCLACSDKIAEFGKKSAEQFGTAVVLAGAALVTTWLKTLNKK